MKMTKIIVLVHPSVSQTYAAIGHQGYSTLPFFSVVAIKKSSGLLSSSPAPATMGEDEAVPPTASTADPTAFPVKSLLDDGEQYDFNKLT